MDGKVESDVPNYAADPEGKKTRLDSHIRLANPRTAESQRNLILRRPFNYSNGVNKNGQLDMGLLFICYQADLEKGFITVQSRLNGEPLEEYLKPVGGGPPKPHDLPTPDPEDTHEKDASGFVPDAWPASDPAVRLRRHRAAGPGRPGFGLQDLRDREHRRTGQPHSEVHRCGEERRHRNG
ncbi:dyp-type peroxidase family protein [Pseudomonas syringae pv. actinidiae ICMP 19070]|nr:dyp-type peroxidase family protein [Pseudomonas syringae pv. actinidiae ICMP 19070]